MQELVVVENGTLLGYLLNMLSAVFFLIKGTKLRHMLMIAIEGKINPD